MFATKGQLKVTLFVVGVLAVSLGTYVVFQVNDAEAHDIQCDVKYHTGHGYFRWQLLWSKLLSTTTKSTTCSNCGGSATETTKSYQNKWKETTSCKHSKTLLGFYSVCHTHVVYKYVYPEETKTKCHDDNCSSNGSGSDNDDDGDGN